MKRGHRGVVMLAEPAFTKKGLKRMNDPFWEPLWACCQELGVPMHWHGSSGLVQQLSLPKWNGFSQEGISHCFNLAALRDTGATDPQFDLLRHSRPLSAAYNGRAPKPASAGSATCSNPAITSGSSGGYGMKASSTRPSEVFRRQIYVDFWYEKAGIELRELVGVDNIMWESDYPHIAATYPQILEFCRSSLAGVPEEERKKMCYGNALRLYGLANSPFRAGENRHLRCHYEISEGFRIRWRCFGYASNAI